MTKHSTIKALEERYHVHIERDEYLAPYYTGEVRESFHIYSGDGDCWDKVLGYKSLVRTLARDKEALKRLAKPVRKVEYEEDW